MIPFATALQDLAIAFLVSAVSIMLFSKVCLEIIEAIEAGE